MLDDLAAHPSTDTGADWAEHARNVLGRAGHHRGAARDRLIDLLAGQDCALSALEIEDALRRGRRGHARSAAPASTGCSNCSTPTTSSTASTSATGSPATSRPTPPVSTTTTTSSATECGKLVAFKDPGLERSIDQLSHRLGFTTTDHEVTLRGNCPDCQ